MAEGKAKQRSGGFAAVLIIGAIGAFVVYAAVEGKDHESAKAPAEPRDPRAFRISENGTKVAKSPRAMWCSLKTGKCDETKEGCTRDLSDCMTTLEYVCPVQKTAERAYAMDCYTTMTKCRVLLMDRPVYAQGGWECAIFTAGG